MSGIFFGFGCVKTARNAARFFVVGFFSALVSSFFESSPFLRGCSERIFVGSSSARSVLVKCVGICCFGGFCDGSFFKCLDLCWVSCSELRSSCLRFRSELPSGIRPRDFSRTSLVSWPSQSGQRTSGGSLLSCFFGRVPSPLVKVTLP